MNYLGLKNRGRGMLDSICQAGPKMLLYPMVITLVSNISFLDINFLILVRTSLGGMSSFIYLLN
jgi:hypothetical protein